MTLVCPYYISTGMFNGGKIYYCLNLQNDSFNPELLLSQTTFVANA